METMNISLPEGLKQFVDDQIDEGGYSSVSEYIRELVRLDQKKRSQESLEAMLLEGLKGEGQVFDKKAWSKLREEAVHVLKSKKSK